MATMPFLPNLKGGIDNDPRVGPYVEAHVVTY